MKIEDYKSADETVLWTGKPNKSVYFKEGIFNPLLLIALAWGAIDFGIIFGVILANNFDMPLYFIIPFFFFHLAPVWFYIVRVIVRLLGWKHIEFMVTDKAVYALSGILTTNFVRRTFQEVTNVSVHQGIFDRHHDVGDVFIITGRSSVNFIDIEDYMKVYKLVAKTGQDIFSDTMYPNDLRPKENHGYQTKYTPEDKK